MLKKIINIKSEFGENKRSTVVEFNFQNNLISWKLQEYMRFNKDDEFPVIGNNYMDIKKEFDEVYKEKVSFIFNGFDEAISIFKKIFTGLNLEETGTYIEKTYLMKEDEEVSENLMGILKTHLINLTNMIDSESNKRVLLNHLYSNEMEEYNGDDLKQKRLDMFNELLVESGIFYEGNFSGFDTPEKKKPRI